MSEERPSRVTVVKESTTAEWEVAGIGCTKAYLRQRRRMVYFNIKLYHKGYFGFVDGVMRYKGQELIIEDNDSDFWSVYEAEEQLRRLGHEDDDISAMWYKDPAVEDYSVGLRQFVKDADALKMVRIGVERGHVELFVVHEDAPEEGFPEIGYIDVPGDPPGENGEPGVEVGPTVEADADLNAGNEQTEEGAVEEDVPNDENVGPDVEEAAPAVGIAGDGVEAGVEVGVDEGVVGEAGLGSAVQEASNEEAVQFGLLCIIFDLHLFSLTKVAAMFLNLQIRTFPKSSPQVLIGSRNLQNRGDATPADEPFLLCTPTAPIRPRRPRALRSHSRNLCPTNLRLLRP
ncbi:hypothetical protein PIB30_008347 [Stylosanthes scabra]|uniref:PB1-like domain-containing protein n=1 Tax=Stylosanthes scabra TaxID=79078 RepID=A0ABU6T4R8_9FABA|nr:hypothetical protein [Stylosanthes scabra]